MEKPVYNKVTATGLPEGLCQWFTQNCITPEGEVFVEDTDKTIKYAIEIKDYEHLVEIEHRLAQRGFKADLSSFGTGIVYTRRFSNGTVNVSRSFTKTHEKLNRFIVVIYLA